MDLKVNKCDANCYGEDLVSEYNFFKCFIMIHKKNTITPIPKLNRNVRPLITKPVSMS